jgi:hypothetical protein
MYFYFVKTTGHHEVAFPGGFCGVYFSRHTNLKAPDSKGFALINYWFDLWDL